MKKEFEEQPMTQWETLPLEFGGWDNVIVSGIAAIAAAALVVFLVVRIACRIARHVR